MSYYKYEVPAPVRAFRLLSLFVLIVVAEATLAAATFEVEKLVPSDVMDRAEFGTSVSVSGDTAIVGAWKDASETGSAIIYRFDGVNWHETQKLSASDAAAAGGFFGYSVSIDGNMAIIGAYTDDAKADRSGSAYIFAFDGIRWSEFQKLTASDAAAGDFFGLSVAIDGNTAIVGAPFNTDPASRGSVAYIFKFNGTRWYEMARLTASDGHFANAFGTAVAIDGDTAIVGASGDYDNGQDSGSIYVFNYDGASWPQTQKLTASDGTAGDRFGGSIAVEGRIAIVGAAADDDKGSYAGSAYMFASDETGWRQVQKLTASDAAASSLFGRSVDVDGVAAIVGAPHSRQTRGSAYVYVFEGTIWQEKQRLLASDRSRGDQVGDSVTLVGRTAIVGAPGDDNTGERRGAAYIFALDLPAAVIIDIKPGSDRNPINLRSNGNIPVAILTSDSFDATQVNWETVRLGPSGATERHQRVHVRDADYDGDMDVVLHFKTRDTGILCGDSEATLTGATFSGEEFTGSDVIKIVKCPKNKKNKKKNRR